MDVYFMQTYSHMERCTDVPLRPPRHMHARLSTLEPVFLVRQQTSDITLPARRRFSTVCYSVHVGGRWLLS